MTSAADPLIVTALPDDASFARFAVLRRAHFPPARNVVPAHVSLFHRLPGEEIADVERTLRHTCARYAPFAATVAAVRSLGAGTAYALVSPELTALRADLARTWETRLTPQDRQGFRPHVVVQNKTTPEAARTLQAELAATFAPYAIAIVGLALWHYRSGPWEHAASIPLGAPADAEPVPETLAAS